MRVIDRLYKTDLEFIAFVAGRQTQKIGDVFTQSMAKINPIYGERNSSHGRWKKKLVIRRHRKGAKASANLYSLVETAKANNVEPSVYLKKVFTRLPAATCVEDIKYIWFIRF